MSSLSTWFLPSNPNFLEALLHFCTYKNCFCTQPCVVYYYATLPSPHTPHVVTRSSCVRTNAFSMSPRDNWCDGYASYYKLWARLERVVSPGCQRISGGESVNSVKAWTYQWVVMASQRTQPRLVPKLAGQDMPHWRITVLGYLHNIEMGSGEPVVRKRCNWLRRALIGRSSSVLASYWLLWRWSCRQYRYKCTAWAALNRWYSECQSSARCEEVE